MLQLRLGHQCIAIVCAQSAVAHLEGNQTASSSCPLQAVLSVFCLGTGYCQISDHIDDDCHPSMEQVVDDSVYPDETVVKEP